MEHARSVESDLKSKSTNFWKYVNQFGDNSSSMQAFSIEDKFCDDSTVLCWKVDEYFKSFYQNGNDVQLNAGPDIIYPPEGGKISVFDIPSYLLTPFNMPSRV